jgi:HlyD family secretion protein
MAKALIAVLLAALIGGVTVAAVLWQRHAHGGAAHALMLYGNVDIRELQLAFRQPGRLLHTACEEGDTVAAGQVLADIDPVPFREAVAVATAEVDSARADLSRLRNGSRPLEIAEAEEAERGARATFVNAEAEFARMNVLITAKAVSESSLDAAHASRDAASAALNAAHHALSLLKEGPRSEDIAAGAARVAAAEARLSQAATALEDTRLVCPAAAVVLTRVREAGSMVSATEPVYTLSLRDPIYIRAYVSERDLGTVAQGTPVTISTDSSTTTYSGQVGFVSPRAEFTPKTVETTDLRTDLVYRVRIVVAHADDALRQGMPVTVAVSVAGATGAPGAATAPAHRAR